ncbi:MAG: trypsin-like serine protease [Anaerolineae bacterium]|nr:trypsin-like serine protease [Anaerolineae bacterium]
MTKAVLIAGLLMPSCATTFHSWVQKDTCTTDRQTERGYPSVGMLWGSGGLSICTATLVARDIVLTAGHCVGDDMLFTPDGRILYSAALLWADSEDGPLHDTALLLLDRPVSGIRPAGLSSRVDRDHDLRFVGYGCFARCKAGDTVYKVGTGRKTSAVLDGETWQPAWYALDRWYPCGGDSGGPVFDRETGKIVAILVAGSATHRWSAPVSAELRARVEALRIEAAP